MALTDAEQAELDRLIAQKVAPEPRTDTGAVGVLHALIDSASGAEAHRSPEAWAALHKQAEALAAPQAAPGPAPTPVPDPAAYPNLPPYGSEGAGFAG